MRPLAYISALLLVTGLASCSWNNREEAIKLCNSLTRVNDSLNVMGKDWMDEFKPAVNTKDFTYLQPKRQHIQDYITQQTVYVKGLKDVGGSEKLRASLLDILQFENDVVLPKMKEFESFNGDTSDSTLQKAFNELITTTKEDMAKHEVMFKHLDEYAEKNDFPKPIE